MAFQKFRGLRFEPLEERQLLSGAPLVSTIVSTFVSNVQATPTSAQASTTIQTQPVVSVGNSGAVIVIRGTAPIVVAPNLTVTDPAGANLVSATVAVGGGPVDAGAEWLAAMTTGTNITATYNASTGTLSLTGTDTAADYQQVLRSVTYVDMLGAAASLGSRTLTFTVTDANSASGTAAGR